MWNVMVNRYDSLVVLNRKYRVFNIKEKIHHMVTGCQLSAMNGFDQSTIVFTCHKPLQITVGLIFTKTTFVTSDLVSGIEDNQFCA